MRKAVFSAGLLVLAVLFTGCYPIQPRYRSVENENYVAWADPWRAYDFDQDRGHEPPEVPYE